MGQRRMHEAKNCHDTVLAGAVASAAKAMAKPRSQGVKGQAGDD